MNPGKNLVASSAAWLLAGMILTAAPQAVAAQAVTSGAGSGLPRSTPPVPAARPAAQRAAADVTTTVENVLVTLLADYEYQLGRGVVFQSQGWYPTFTVLHPEQDIVLGWDGDRVSRIGVTLLYAKRGLDSGLLLPEQIAFMLPETEAWFLSVTARRLTEAVERLGRGSPPVTWEVLLPVLDAEGQMVWKKGVTATVTPAEARGDPQALATRLAAALRAGAPKP